VLTSSMEQIILRWVILVVLSKYEYVRNNII